MESVINNGDWKFDYRRGKVTYRTDLDTAEEKYFRYGDDDVDERDKDFKKAALIHKITRDTIRPKLVDGASIKEIVTETEDLVLKLFRHNRDEYFSSPSTDGLAFPVGVSVNNVVAHDSALLEDRRTLEMGDIVKFDFGTHVNGHIIDAAFTHVVDEKEEDSLYYNLLEASRDATYSAIAASGPDARLLELSELIEDVITSYELPIDSQTDSLDIIPITGLGGHNILPYNIHGGKLIFSTPDEEYQEGMKMEEGEIFAIETFATTGYGNMTQPDDVNMCSHFMVNHDKNNKKFIKKSEAYEAVKNRNGLPFTLSWCDMSGKKFNRDFKRAIAAQDIIAYPPLYDVDNSRVAQFEHTIRIKDNGVVIYSKGDDY